MIDALRYEWTRITTLRSTWWISGMSVLVGAGFTFVVWMFLRLTSPGDIEGELVGDGARFYYNAAMTQFSNVDPMFYLVAYAVAILGILSWGHEYRHSMIRATLTTVPQRWTVWLAKYLVVGAWVSVVVVLTCVLSLVCAMLWFAGLDADFDAAYLLAALAKRVVYTVMVTWLVMSATVLIRHQTFALVLLYLWPLGVETLIRFMGLIVGAITGDSSPDGLRFMPFNAAGRLVQDVSITDPTGGIQDSLDLFGNPLSFWGAFLVFGLYTFVLMAASIVAFQKRDA